MPVNLGNPIWLTTVSDSDTPASLVQYAGRIIGVPAGVVLPPDGKIDTITVSGLTLWGYLRTNVNGQREFVIAAPVNPNVTAVNAIPSRGSWTDLTARGVYYTIGQALLGLGVPGPDLRTGLKSLYDNAVIDYVAAVADGAVPPPPGPPA